MNKIRLIWSILTTLNYIVITDRINDGYIEPRYLAGFAQMLKKHLVVIKETMEELRKVGLVSEDIDE